MGDRGMSPGLPAVALFRNYYFAKLLFRKTTISQKKILFHKLCNATTISKTLFRKTTISKTTISKTLFRKTTISQNYYFAKLLFRNNYFAKILFRKCVICS